MAAWVYDLYVMGRSPLIRAGIVSDRKQSDIASINRQEARILRLSNFAFNGFLLYFFFLSENVFIVVAATMHATSCIAWLI